MGFQNLTGQTLGQYELRELLGAGGMGAVYRGYQRNLKRYVAVKVISAEFAGQAGYLERFTREAETSAALQHPNIITIHDYGMQGGISYLVLELLNGGTLAERLEQHAEAEGPLPSLGEVADLLKQLGSALDYAHSEGVVHRDIKPSNVMFDNHGHAYLVDFGIAKLAAATQALTKSGIVIGTWGYMAPEQWRNEDLTGATDQYALGVMTYALLTGVMPFEADTPAGTMHRHLNEMPVPPHNHNPEVPEAVTLVIERALAKQAGDRFPTCTAFAQAFDGAIRGQTGQKTAFFTAPVKRKPPATSRMFTPPVSPPGTGTAERPIYRHPFVWLLMVALLIAIGVIGFLVLGGGDEGGTATEVPAAAVIPTETATRTSSPTDTVAPTATEAPLVILITDTTTPTGTPTATPSPTETSLPTQTATLTRTATDTPTITPSLTETMTPTPSATETPRPTATRTPTLSGTEIERTIQAEMFAVRTQTAAAWTATPSNTPTPTIDIHATAAARVAMTETAAARTATAAAWTATPTATDTATPTLTPTPSDTPTDTPTPTATLTPTATATATNTPTATPTPTNTPTDTPTATATSTNTPTTTPTPSNTPTPTATPDPLQAALERARSFSGGNEDWEEFVWDFDGVEMVLVPAGCFEMGNNERSDEQPMHRVCFEELFWIDRTEVTNGQFAAFDGQAERTSRFDGEDRPREQITWYEASTYCESRGARLPTEAEWEYAAAGPDGWVYPWGDEWDGDKVVWDGNSNGQTANVGSKPAGASWVGAVDLSGNVWEWVADWYGSDYYGTLGEGVVNPTGPENGDARVLRGGSWAYNYGDSVFFRAASRNSGDPRSGYGDDGFRCARDVDQYPFTASDMQAATSTSPSPAETSTPTSAGDSTPAPTPVTSSEPCTITATRDAIEVRLGPGFNRGVLDYLVRGTVYDVTGQQTMGDGSEWWQILFRDAERWVLKNEVDTAGACDAVPDTDAPELMNPDIPGYCVWPRDDYCRISLRNSSDHDLRWETSVRSGVLRPGGQTSIQSETGEHLYLMIWENNRWRTIRDIVPESYPITITYP